MGTYFAQALTVSGDPEAVSDFARRCLTKGEDGAWCGLEPERIIPVPRTLPGVSISTLFGRDIEVGVEALTGRTPLRIIEGIEISAPSVLDQPECRKRRIKTHEQLLNWLEKKHPEVIAAGRAAIESHAATGYWDRESWAFDHWGGAHYLTDLAAEQEQTGRLVLRFTTKDMPISPLVRHLGCAFPALEFRLAGIDGDYEFPFVVTVKDSMYRERKVKETQKFVNEIGGPQPDPIMYDRSSEKIHRLWVWMPHHLLARSRLRRHIKDYPVFSPPVPGFSYSMSAEQAAINFEYFLSKRIERKRNLVRFFRKFGIDLNSTDQSLDDIDHWIRKYGPYLPPIVFDRSFEGRFPEWTGARLGYNVILDLGTFLGDVIIDRNAGFAWEIFDGVRASRQRDSLDFQSIVIRSQRRSDRGRIDPISDVYNACIFRRLAVEPRESGAPRLPRDLEATYRRTASLIVATAPDVVARPGQSFAYLRSVR
ncbi:hypothetical protein [Enterovirga rhinocerotis]|uniref:Uncharacterized protein n=1 Tax=Enterovirga rhinocerotis TaxID=1339210 RepID=A0A4R7C5N5_9HYPH|nr:hypothetical protein [Enterovirga rhinocerotis]TDR93864.1 hypothetical protein EV668_1133 [Enterovirga rhinocerotis]